MDQLCLEADEAIADLERWKMKRLTKVVDEELEQNQKQPEEERKSEEALSDPEPEFQYTSLADKITLKE